MPTLKDIQKQAREIWGLKIGTKSNQFDQEKVLFEIIDLAFQAGLDMVLKEIEEHCVDEDNLNSSYVLGFNQALSSLKEKIISDNQK